MDQAISPALIVEIEQALAHVAEIRAARIVSSDDGVIQEIHILADPSKSPKQLVRDIESTIMAQFGIPIDHKKVSIAQLGREAISAEERTRRNYRPGRASTRYRPSHGRARGRDCPPGAGRGDVHGYCRGTCLHHGTTPAGRQATLNAVEQYTMGTFGFALEDVAIVTLGRERVAVTCVILVTPLGEQALTGSRFRAAERERLTGPRDPGCDQQATGLLDNRITRGPTP